MTRGDTSAHTATRSRRVTRATALHALADRVGILPGYVDQSHQPHTTSDETRVALLAAMGHDAADAAAARRTLDALDALDADRLLGPVRVIERPVPGTAQVKPTSRVARPRGPDAQLLAVPVSGTGEWTLKLVEEGGDEHHAEGRARAGRGGRAMLRLPSAPPLGYHRLHLTMHDRRGVRTAEQALIVVPSACPAAADVLVGQRAFGVTANLYSVRSARNWGAGDFTDLRALADFAGAIGAAFIGVNPLHALRNQDGEISPYSPVSRLFRNVLYIDVEAVPELADCADARARIASPAVRRELAAARATTQVDYAAVMRLKRPLLEALHRTFRDSARATRRTAYRRYVRSEGEALTNFATFVALDEHFRAGGVRSWRDWPEAFRSPASPTVAAFRREHASTIDFHRWLQFELDEQLGAAAAHGRELALPIGLYQDLAIGTSPNSSDVWSFPGLFLTGASVGAPPDPLALQGQNWGLAPIDPSRLADQGYAYWRQLVHGALRHTGALRIDHVLGLFRQFWIADSMTADAGAYVRFPTADLLGIVALESTRAKALVVGEDLGTVPPEVPPTLERWRVLSSKVLYFEREANGAFIPPRSYPRMALATANTHDLPTLAGFWRGRDIELRRTLGLIQGVRAGRAADAERERDRQAVIELLVAEGLVDGADSLDELRLRAAVHVLLRRTPSWLVGLSLDDLAGEVDPVNLPGVGLDDYPSWTRRLSAPLETLVTDPRMRSALGIERHWTAPVGPR